MLKKEYKFIIALFAVLVIFFYPVLFLGKIPFPGDLLIGAYNPWRSYSFLGFAPGGYPNKAQYFDVLRQLYPWRELVVESFRQFSVPLWNPYNFSGSPLMANDQSSAFYPFNLIYFLLPHYVAWAFLVMLQPLLASIGTYFFVRKIGIGKWGSLLASLAYGFSLFQSVFLEYNTMGHVVALLPWTLLGIELLIANKKIIGSLLIVDSLVFSFFAGHIQLWGFSLLFVSAYLLYRLSSVKNKMLFGISSVFLLIISFGIMSMQLIPTLELIGQAARVTQNYHFLVNNLLIQPYQLIVLLIPDMFGNPATRNYLLSDSYPGNALYIGLLPILFALFAMVKFRQNRHLWFFTGMSVLLLLILVRTPVTEVFYKIPIPFFSTGSPSNAIFLLSFGLAVLAGFGLDFFTREKDKRILFTVLSFFIIISLDVLLSKVLHIQVSYKNVLFSVLLLIIGSLMIGIGHFLPKKKVVISFVVIIITIFDLFYFFQKFNPFVKPALMYPSVQVTQTLQSLVGSQRVWSYGEGNVESNVWSMYHVQDPNGYDPLYPKVYGEFISSSIDGKIHTTFTNQSRSDAVIAPAYQEADLGKNPYRFKVLDATSVSYILSKEVLSSDFLTKQHWELARSVDGWNIYHNFSALPHAYVVGAYATYSGPEDFSQKFYAATFDVHSSVLLDTKIAPLSGTTGSAQIVSYAPEKVTIQTKTNGRKLLVLTDTYFPGWEATIDGKRVPILKANYTFRAVAIPEGTHTITFLYHPASFSTGLTLTIIGIIGLIIFLFLVQKLAIFYE